MYKKKQVFFHFLLIRILGTQWMVLFILNL